jgi:hypothetical protein
MVHCAHCTTEASVGHCADCRKVAYCGKECQKAHWNSGHSFVCKIAKKSDDTQLLDKDHEEEIIENTKSLHPLAKDLVMRYRRALLYEYKAERIFTKLLKDAGVKDSDIRTIMSFKNELEGASEEKILELRLRFEMMLKAVLNVKDTALFEQQSKEDQDIFILVHMIDGAGERAFQMQTPSEPDEYFTRQDLKDLLIKDEFEEIQVRGRSRSPRQRRNKDDLPDPNPNENPDMIQSNQSMKNSLLFWKQYVVSLFGTAASSFARKIWNGVFYLLYEKHPEEDAEEEWSVRQVFNRGFVAATILVIMTYSLNHIYDKAWEYSGQDKVTTMVTNLLKSLKDDEIALEEMRRDGSFLEKFQEKAVEIQLQNETSVFAISQMAQENPVELARLMIGNETLRGEMAPVLGPRGYATTFLSFLETVTKKTMGDTQDEDITFGALSGIVNLTETMKEAIRNGEDLEKFMPELRGVVKWLKTIMTEVAPGFTKQLRDQTYMITLLEKEVKRLQAQKDTVISKYLEANDKRRTIVYESVAEDIREALKSVGKDNPEEAGKLIGQALNSSPLVKGLAMLKGEAAGFVVSFLTDPAFRAWADRELADMFGASFSYFFQPLSKITVANWIMFFTGFGAAIFRTVSGLSASTMSLLTKFSDWLTSAGAALYGIKIQDPRIDDIMKMYAENKIDTKKSPFVSAACGVTLFGLALVSKTTARVVFGGIARGLYSMAENFFRLNFYMLTSTITTLSISWIGHYICSQVFPAGLYAISGIVTEPAKVLLFGAVFGFQVAGSCCCYNRGYFRVLYDFTSWRKNLPPTWKDYLREVVYKDVPKIGITTVGSLAIQYFGFDFFRYAFIYAAGTVQEIKKGNFSSIIPSKLSTPPQSV